jgi:hypothetical protein
VATVGTGGAGSLGTVKLGLAGAVVVAVHGTTVVATASANLGRAAGAQMSSVNQMNKEVKAGQAPSEVKRVDKGNTNVNRHST